MAVFETRAAVAEAAIAARLRVDECRAGDGKHCRRGNYRFEHVILHRCLWCENDEPMPRQSKLNFGQEEVLAGLKLCNLGQQLEL
jgi:hypothetical protein